MKKELKFYEVSNLKLITFSLLSFNIYQIYWFYKNWKIISDNFPEKKIIPLLWALFRLISSFSMFKIIIKRSEEKGFKNIFSSDLLGIIYLILNLSPSLFAYFLSSIVLIPINNAIIHNNKNLEK